MHCGKTFTPPLLQGETERNYLSKTRDKYHRTRWSSRGYLGCRENPQREPFFSPQWPLSPPPGDWEEGKSVHSWLFRSCFVWRGKTPGRGRTRVDHWFRITVTYTLASPSGVFRGDRISSLPRNTISPKNACEGGYVHPQCYNGTSI